MTPAFLGGDPTFDLPLPFARPTIEDPEGLARQMRRTLTSGMLTDGPLVYELEERVTKAFEVHHCVAVSSATVGLMLVLQAIGSQGPVLLPSFTFPATAHAARWNGAGIAFADCDPDTWTLTGENVYGKPEVIIGVHVSGVPADVEGLRRRAQELGSFLVFDAAHGAGSRAGIGENGRSVGEFGLAEVFSLTPTEVMSGVEGGLITTNDASLADHLRVARNYGNPGDYDTRFAGLNARLSELHAALALESLRYLPERVTRRNAIADHYHEALGDIPGVGFQQVPPGALSSYRDFTILLDEEAFGASRDAVVAALAADGILTRKYYSPPVHRQHAYADVESPDLPVTDRLAEQVISLPIWSHLPLDAVKRIGNVFESIHEYAAEVQEALTRADG